MRDDGHVQLHWGLKVPLRDGTELSANVYTPKHQAKPAPCVLTLTPYVADAFHERGVYFAARGLPFAIVDVRGRGNSAGDFHPAFRQGEDGHDVVEWLAGQPYCNGKVAMWGGSYGGYLQWATAKEAPAHLATIVPAASTYRGVDSPMRNNIFYPERMQWLALTSGRTAQTRLYQDEAFWCALYRQWHESGTAFRDIDAMLGRRAPLLQEWLAHPQLDEYWDAQNPRPEHYAQLQLPILSITGFYDDNQPGTLEHYRQHMRCGSAEARARHYLIIGPWDHAGTRTPAAEFGGLRVGPASLIDLPNLHVEWYAWTLQGAPRPEFLRKRVAYYVMGAEEWRYADTLEEVTASQQPYYLDSNGAANDLFASGSLGAQAGTGRPDTYRYDPRQTRGPEVEAEERSIRQRLTDQGVAHALAGRQFVYHTAQFEQDLDVCGFFRLSLWLAIDCPDTDFYVSIHEVDQDGASIRLTADAMRARYREGLRTAKLIETREALRYDFQRFTFVARQVRRGHRLRLIIAPFGRQIDAAFTQKNYNGGGVVANESAADGRPVTVTLLHDDAHPSALYVPLGRSDSHETAH